METTVGLVHRLRYHSNGQKHAEEWFCNNILHRVDGPATQYWFDSGQLFAEIWYLNGETHRVNGPSNQEWVRNGHKKYEEWRVNNNFHRVTGPARIKWDINGKVEYEFWFLKGRKLSVDQSREYKNWLSDNNMLCKDNLTDEEKVLLKLRWL